jgi:hypothetical protein
MIRAPLATFLTTVMPTLADDAFVLVVKDNTTTNVLRPHFAVYVLVPDEGEKETCLDMLHMFGSAVSIGFQGTLSDCKNWLSIKPMPAQPDTPGAP